MNIRAIVFGLLTLFFAVFAGTADKAFADPFAPEGEWISPGFDFSLTFKLDDGKVLFREEGRTSERQVVVVGRSEYFLHLAPFEGEGVNRRASFEVIRLNDDAMAFSGGCAGGFLLVRKEAGLVLADKPPAGGRFGFPEEDGTYLWLIDFDKGVILANGREGPLQTRKSPLKGAIRLDADRMTFDVRLVGDAILAAYLWDEKAGKSMPPFGLVAVP